MIPLFFAMRAIYEYIVELVTARAYGSDGLPVMSFFGVALHEICLSVMITSVKHPAVFCTLLASDVLENAYCLYSLHAAMQRTKKRPKSSRVVPRGVVADPNVDSSAATRKKRRKMMRKKNKRKSLTMRHLAQSIEMSVDDAQSGDNGTALFIVAILLLREFTEMMVPLQALMVTTALYVVGEGSNSIVNGWSSKDFEQATMYIGVDFAVECVVFVGTVVALRWIFPRIDATNVILGLLKQHGLLFFFSLMSAWVTLLVFQVVYSGIDMSFRFEWLRCSYDDSRRWDGGFNWVDANGTRCL